MKIVSVIFTIIVIVLVSWLVIDTAKLIINKIKERKEKNKKDKNVIEQKDDNKD